MTVPPANSRGRIARRARLRGLREALAILRTSLQNQITQGYEQPDPAVRALTFVYEQVAELIRKEQETCPPPPSSNKAPTRQALGRSPSPFLAKIMHYGKDS